VSVLACDQVQQQTSTPAINRYRSQTETNFISWCKGPREWRKLLCKM